MDSPQEYEQVSKHGAALTQGLMRVWEKLGCPNDCSTESGWIMLDQIVNCWTAYFRGEAESWIRDRDIDLKNEMTLSQLSKKDGGYNPVTFPPTLFSLLKTMLPDQKLTDKKFHHKLVQRHPLFKTTNLGI